MLFHTHPYRRLYLVSVIINILIDEAHYDPNWSIVVKGLYDRIQSRGSKTKIIVTGSSSALIDLGIKENLSGRVRKLFMFPMKFSELLRAKGYKEEVLCEVSKLVRKSLFEGSLSSLEEAEATLINIGFIKSLLSDYMIRGGMPEIVFKEKVNYKEEKELLLNYVSLSIYKDILRAFETIRRSFRRPGLLEDLMRIIAYKSPREMNYNSLASALGIKVDTAENLVSAILSTMYVIQARNYAKHPEIIARKRKRKYFFIDTGVRNALAGVYKPIVSTEEEGLIMENLALTNALRITIEEKIGNEVYYWREGEKEIDVVTESFCIEVKRGRKYRISPFIAFARKYGEKVFIKLTIDELGKRDNIIMMPIHLFLLA